MSLNAQGARITILTLGLSAAATAAYAHVKWFEKYEVAANPVPITSTLALPAFWFAIMLVTVLFLATTILERRAPGEVATGILDKGSRLLRDNADAFMIAVMAAFFIALFAVGGSYLTPELKTAADMCISKSKR